MKPGGITKYIRITGAGCLYIAVISTAIGAGPPIAFDSFTVTNGTITPSGCTSAVGGTATCSDIEVDNGMLQRRVTITGAPITANNGTYVQFILTDPGVSGNAAAAPFTASRGSLDFVNEDFVRMGNRGSGIASKNAIYDSDFVTPDLEDRFQNVTKYEFGWAQSTAFPWINIHQDVSQIDYTDYNLTLGVSPPVELFKVTADITSNASGFNTSIKDEFYQFVDMGTTDAQKFHYITAAGIYNPTDKPGTFSGPTPILPGGTNGGDISWGLGEKVAALWVGQSLLDDGGGVFGITRYDNLDLGSNTLLTSFVSPEAVNWTNPPFGTNELLATTHVITPTAVVAAPLPLTPTVAAGTAAGAFSPVAAPIAFNNWTVAGGLVTTDPCPLGVTCESANVSGQGIMQRAITVGGDEYFQTIVTADNATGDPALADFTPGSLAFRQESFVKRNTNGVMSDLHITDQNLAYFTQPASVPMPSNGGQFAYNALVKTGWARGGAGDPILTLDQTELVPDDMFINASSVDYRFHMETGDTLADRVINITDVVGTSNIASVITNNAPSTFGPEDTVIFQGTGFVQPIMFRTERISGAFQTSTHTLLDPDLLPSVSGDIAWAPGDAIAATWVGGAYTTSDPSGPSIIDSMSYVNQSTGIRTASTNTSVNPPNPESWVSPFGAPTPTWVTIHNPAAPTL